MRGILLCRETAFLLTSVLLPGLLSPSTGLATDRFVWKESPSSAAPYTNWASAAHSIQAAVDYARDGETVWVTNGTYTLTGAIQVTNQVTLKSVQGDHAAIIDGDGPATSNRCFHLSGSNVVLEGFTITNGFAAGAYGGGVLAEGENTLIQGCTVAGNTADRGGGIFIQGTNGTVRDCVILGNGATYYGGGVDAWEGAALVNCVITDNGGTLCTGGGIAFEYEGGQTGRVLNCFITGNRGRRGGGIEAGGVLHVVNSTITDNSALEGGGGVRFNGASTSNLMIRNTIIYYNMAKSGTNYAVRFWGSEAPLRCEYTCTMPLPEGPGNFTNQPGLLSPWNPLLVNGSPCRNAGTNAVAEITYDIHGEGRTNEAVVDIGCDEWWGEGMTGEVTASVLAMPLNAVLGYPQKFVADVQGRADVYDWNFGDGTVLGDVCVVSHTYATTGTFDVVLTLANNDVTVADTVTVHIVHGYTNYASLAGADVPPFESWEDAAAILQDAVDDNSYAGGVTLVAPGVYDRGGATVGGLSNRVAVAATRTLMAADPDPGKTVIMGQGPNGPNAVRGAYLAGHASLIGFTVTNGATSAGFSGPDTAWSGGGIFCDGDSYVSNCVVAGNAADRYGGGAAFYQGGTMENCLVYSNAANVTGHGYGGGLYCLEGGRAIACTFSNNIAYNDGGGIFGDQGGWFEDCIVISNFAGHGGGVRLREGGVLTNSLVRGNQAEWSSGGVQCYRGGLVVDSTISSNAAGSYAGGVSMSRGGTLRGCLVDGNTTELGASTAGGVHARESVVADCVIRGNTGSDGGGLYLKDSIASNCVVDFNTATRYGGGIYFYKGGTATHCRVYENRADEYGGGVNGYLGGTLTDSVVTGNHAIVDGGGIFLYRGGLVERSTINHNTAHDDGGGAYLSNSSSGTGTLVNCVLFGNNSGDDGGGIFFHNGGISESCTIAGNAAPNGEGGGVQGNGAGTLRNSIVMFNTAAVKSNYNTTAFLTFDHCCTAPSPGGSSLDDDPLLVNLALGNCRVQHGSPCIDRGYDLGAALVDDLDGAPRPVDGDMDSIAAFDIGCYEYDAATADSNEDGVPDAWYLQYAMDPTLAGLADQHHDADPHTTGQEYAADTNPTNAASYLRITAVSLDPPCTVHFDASSNRLYSLEYRLASPLNSWMGVVGQTLVPGSGGPDSLRDTNTFPGPQHYRVGAAVP